MHYNVYNDLSMLGLKLNHVSKRGPRCFCSKAAVAMVLIMHPFVSSGLSVNRSQETHCRALGGRRLGPCAPENLMQWLPNDTQSLE